MSAELKSIEYDPPLHFLRANHCKQCEYFDANNTECIKDRKDSGISYPVSPLSYGCLTFIHKKD